MVQVTNGPYEEQEPMIQGAGTNSQNEPDDLKSDRAHSVAEVAYNRVASCMMADPINITNPSIALGLLETALKNRNVPLAKHCMITLNQHVQTDNALKIMLSISKWLHTPETDQPMTNFEPSAPPLVDNDDDRDDSWMKEPLEQLRQNCILEIDKIGDAVLKDKGVQDLYYQDLLAITTRDSLLVSNELLVYSAIVRWCMEEGKRKGLTNESMDMKALLGDLVYAPRYGLLKKSDFLIRAIDGFKGPDRIGILDESETDQILDYIKQKEKKKKDIAELPRKMSQARRNETAKKENKLGEKVLINCLTCWSVVFD